MLLEQLLPYIHVYFVAPVADATPEPVFYIHDEVGSRLKCVSDDEGPNMCLSLFVCVWDGVGYTLAWPTRDVHEGETLSCAHTGDRDTVRQMLGLHGYSEV